jgi:ABC-type polysaccharide/polyol phosphate export permease
MFAVRRRTTYRQTSGIPGPIELLREALAEVASRQQLIRYLVVAEMKKRGSDTLLGNLWWILDPVLQMVVYVVFVSILLATKAQPDYPLFIFAAILPYKWFSSVVTDATVSVIKDAALIRQIAFPKIILPVASATGGVVGFAWGLIPLTLVTLLYGRLTPFILWVPIIALVQYVFSIAAAIFVSAANVFFRDLGNVAGHLLRLWWFLSPSLYSLQMLDDYRFVREHPIVGTLAHLNPFAILFDAYRGVIYGSSVSPYAPPSGGPDLVNLAGLLIASVVLVAVSAVFFKRLEPEFAKVL